MPQSLFVQLALVLCILLASCGLVAFGIWFWQWMGLAPSGTTSELPFLAPGPAAPVVMVDPRPLSASPVPLPGDESHRGEVWLACGQLPVNARQLALVLAKLPVGTQVTGIEPDPINGEHAVKMGFVHWCFAGPDPEKFPNGPRLWVSWENDTNPVISWPTAKE